MKKNRVQLIDDLIDLVEWNKDQMGEDTLDNLNYHINFVHINCRAIERLSAPYLEMLRKVLG